MANIIEEVEQAVEVAGEVAVTITVDQSELAAGQSVALPKVQVGTVGGKALFLEGTLTTATS